MRYKIYLIVYLTLILHCPSALSDDQRYRVELLVLRHLDGHSELIPQTTLRDFSSAQDLLLSPAAVADEEPPVVDGAPAVGGETGQLAAAEESPEADPAAQIVLVETQSDTMQLAWQRLRSSSAYRPELYLSWEQPGQEPFPLIRLHDQAVLFEDDPYAELRLNPDSAGHDAVAVFTDIGATANGSNADGDGAATAVALPEPTRFYHLDGSARLSRSRFLHLELDIEYREPLPADATPQQPQPAPNLADGEAPQPGPFLVHTLHLSRQVQIQEMEYFDGPVIAVLALVSRAATISNQDTTVDTIPE